MEWNKASSEKDGSEKYASGKSETEKTKSENSELKSPDVRFAEPRKPEPDKPASGKPASGKPAPQRATAISAADWVATAACCVPLIIELLAVFLIPYIPVLCDIPYTARLGWTALSVPMKVCFLSTVILGFGIQVLGLFEKLNKPLGMGTQLATFLLFALAAYAAYNNAASAFVQWGLGLLVPISMVVAVLRYLSAYRFGFFDGFNFWHYLPIAFEVAEYGLMFLVFPLMFGTSVTLWIFLALTVTTVGAIAVSSFWEDFRWAAVGINLAVAVLLCFVYWLGIFFSSEWLWNGGIIIVVILAIGGSIFLHWFIHRNDI